MTLLPAPSTLAAARHVLTSPSIVARTSPHLGDGRIDWHGILAESATMSAGQRFLVDIARRLYSGETLPSDHEVSGRLDVLGAQRVADALDLVAGPARAELAHAA